MVGYLAHVWRLRYFWSSLVRIDLRTRYRRSVLGIGWSLLNPILMTVVLCAVFCPLFGADYRHFAPFLLSGLAFWNFLVSTASQGCHCFYQGEAYIRQHAAPLAIYPLRTALGTAIHGAAALSMAMVLTWCIQGFGNLPALLSLIPTLFLMLLLGWSLAVCCGITNVMFPDAQHLIDVLFQILFYLTPVMYPARMLAERRMEWMVRLNPLSSFLELLRAPILEGRLASWGAYATATAMVAILMALAALALSRMERRLIFYL